MLPFAENYTHISTGGLSGVTEILDPNARDLRYRAVQITSDGTGSQINLSSLINFVDLYATGTIVGEGRSSFLRARNGATIIATAFGPPFVGVEIIEETGGDVLTQ